MADTTAPEPEITYDTTASRTSLRELAAFFLRLGLTAFGGPAAHIAIMEDELVRRRRWLSRESFLDLLGASSLIPGPSSSELAIHIGYLRGGWTGLLVAGWCFILPAAIIVVALAWLYVRFGALPAVSAILYAVKPVVIAIVLQALWGLGRTAMKNWYLGLIGLFAAVTVFLGLHPLLLLLIAGSVAVLIHLRGSQPILTAWPFPTASIATAAIGASAFSLGSLFLVFLKIGAVVFGSGYVLLAFLRADLVVHRGWMTDPQLVDAVAIGQLTPGPVFTTATFIGYLLGGLRGSVVATVGIFLPAFVLVAASGPLIPRIRGSKLAGAFLDGVNVGSLALMAYVSWQLGRVSIVDFTTVGIMAISTVALTRWRLNSAWLVLGGAAIGLLAHLVRCSLWLRVL
jgi:chromate transporter